MSDKITHFVVLFTMMSSAKDKPRIFEFYTGWNFRLLQILLSKYMRKKVCIYICFKFLFHVKLIPLKTRLGDFLGEKDAKSDILNEKIT